MPGTTSICRASEGPLPVHVSGEEVAKTVVDPSKVFTRSTPKMGSEDFADMMQAVPGAYFSVGDPHAAQGDSELGGTAIETSLTGDFEFILHKKNDLGGTTLEGLAHPMLETKQQWSVYGFTFPNYLAELGNNAQTEVAQRSSLDKAMRDAFRKLRRFLMQVHHMSEDEAIALMSVAADFGVTQVVDANWGVHGSIRKSVFTRG